ncbi:hypothetical protein [Lactiplantibacillus plantarum]|uniref:hypothetical protein n=1 Tax=Lactiplantibacillus plantarum TaxID=1590 RepID=UPI001BA52390|nr:hypothetical protein [Lactiplantibacillus plantarum]MBS0954973.1 hypothetical protein [Lactiplantibacillus plantarum]
MKINIELITPEQAQAIFVAARLKGHSNVEQPNPSAHLDQDITKAFNIEKPEEDNIQTSLFDDNNTPITECTFRNVIGELKPFTDLDSDDKDFYLRVYGSSEHAAEIAHKTDVSKDRVYPEAGQLDLWGGVSDGLDRFREQHPITHHTEVSLNDMTPEERENFYATYKGPEDITETHTSILDTEFVNKDGNLTKFRDLTDAEQSIVLDSLMNLY